MDKHKILTRFKRDIRKKITDKWAEVFNEGKRREVREVGPLAFAVKSKFTPLQIRASHRFVCLVQRNCSCGRFQDEKFPCYHAVAAILLSGVDFMEYIDYKYKVNCIRRIYSVFYSLVDVITVAEDGETIIQNVVKKRGRPRKLRIRSRGESAVTRRIMCRNCGGIGHNSYTCHVQLQSGTSGVSGPTQVSVNDGSQRPRPPRKVYSCKACGQPGHNRATCSYRRLVEEGTVPRM